MDKADLDNKTVLVVEDEERNWYVLRDIIQFCNGNPKWAESGMEAIKQVRENESIGLVLMDIRLPFMSGIEATKEIKAIRPELPVIAQTAFTDEKQIKEYKEAGCSDCLFKPVNFNQVIGILKQYLNS